MVDDNYFTLNRYDQLLKSDLMNVSKYFDPKHNVTFTTYRGILKNLQQMKNYGIYINYFFF